MAMPPRRSSPKRSSKASHDTTALITGTSDGDVLVTAEEWDASWENAKDANEAEERAEYERLKRKFEAK